MTIEELRAVNEKLNSIDLKGKQYVPVTERVKAFREMITDGTIQTEILHLDEEKVIMRATVIDEMGRVLATGTAMEREGASFINKTSHIENAETSAVGRALGFLGIGVDASMASAEEVANAILQQGEPKPNKYATEVERKIFTDLCDVINVEPTTILERVGWTKGKMTSEQYAKALVLIKKIQDNEQK